jgi:hypothetical protein
MQNLTTITAGTILRYPVYDEGGVLLLKGGMPLTTRLAGLLEARQISLALYATLQVTRGAGDQTEIALKNTTLVIGRGPDCDLRPAHSVVSKKHCMLRRQAYRVLIQDLNSTNGTFVNGRRVTQDAIELADNDIITLGGGVSMTVRIFAAVQGDYGEEAVKGTVVTDNDDDVVNDGPTRMVDASSVRAMLEKAGVKIPQR